MKTRRWGIIWAAVLVVVLFIALPLLRWVARVWTDYVWFADLGQQQVFTTRILSQLVVGAVFAVAAFVVLYGNMFAARKIAPRVVPVGLPEGTPVQVADFITALRRRIGPILDRVIPLVAAWFAFLSGTSMAGQWEIYRIALEAPKFGAPDPHFGRDIGFFLFTLPALESFGSWLTGILILSTILALVVHLVDGAIQPWARLKGFAPHVKAHLSVLLAGIVLSRAYDYWLSIWNLSYSQRGQVVGLSYTDVHAQLPAYRILIVISIVTAAVLLLNIRYRGWRLPLVSLGVWVVASVLVGGVWPGLVQQFRVNPNEAALEAPYIERNIATTRRAFGLSDMKGRAFPASTNLTADDVERNADVLANVRLWDPEIVADSYAQLQSIRSYYEFADVDVDRYEIGGTKRQVLVSAREMNSSLLDEKAQNWVNTHLVYTHGFGLVVSPVNESDSRGIPLFLLGDVPPRVSSQLATGAASAALQIKQPRIYFGERTRDYVIVNTGKPEFDYPLGDTNAMYEYEAERGPKIGAFPQRIAWALRLGSSQVLFSNYITSDSRVLMTREVLPRLQKLAPWLRFEDDPYATIVDGRIVWIVDAYTYSDRFPYSERLSNGTNYLRNSVKVTVDAFTGETTFYAMEPEEPVLRAWSNVFPTLVREESEIPDQVRQHFRYPQGMFTAQAEVFRTYHMTDVNVFFNKEDQWEIPLGADGSQMEPFFVLLKLPGTDREHFYMIQPYSPRNKKNMIGWVAASSDPENYGERTIYQFPKERSIVGPEQVRARINQDPVISPQLSLWNQRGSEVIFGSMQIIPLEESIVYIQPLFLRAAGAAMPELTRVIVAYHDKVEMERTLEDALLRVFTGESAGEREEPAGEAGGEPGESQAATVAEAQRLYEQAIEAQKRGDWAEYGRLIEQLGTVLQDLSSPDSTSTP